MNSTSSKKNQFLSGGGEMGELIRKKDWSKHQVGSPEHWPQSLRTTISIILNSKFPMFLFWGPEQICFYNDAYRPSLGESGKHPEILGAKGVEAWPEIWSFIKPLIDQVLAGGDAVFFEDQFLPIFRNGRMEDVYWTFSYSPVTDETGKPAGVFVACVETTDKVKLLNDTLIREDQYEFTIDAAELATWDLNPKNNKFIGNDRLKEWFGLAITDEIDLPLALASIVDQDRERVTYAIQNTLRPGSDGRYEIEYRILNTFTKQERKVLAKGKALFNEKNEPIRFSGTLQDISEREAALKKAAESEKKFRTTVDQAPVGITIFYGSEFVVDMANQTYLQLVGRTKENFEGKPLFESLPEVKDAVGPLLRSVMTTGVPYYGFEFPVTLNRYGKSETTYFNFVYHPLKKENGEIEGIMVVATEVTASIQAKHALAESEKQFRNLVMQSPIPMTIFRGKDYIVEMANKVMFEKIWRRKEADVLGKKIVEAFPELIEQKYPELLDQVFETGKTHSEKESLVLVQGEDGMQRFYLDFEYAPLFGTDHQVSGIIVTVNDVSEKVEARKKVETAVERLRLATEATGLATWDLDLIRGEIVHSYRLAEIFGHDKDVKIPHVNMRAQIHRDDIHAIVEKAFDVALKTGVYRYEARVVRPDNSIRWIQTRGKVFFDDAGKPLKVIGTLGDITEQRIFTDELERQVRERTVELLEKNKELEKMNTELQSFAYVSSHDLQEPLRKIQTFASRIIEKEQERLSETGKDYFARMQAAAKRMQTLIEDLLAYSRTNTTDHKFETTDLNKILEQVKADLKEDILQKNAIIKSDKLFSANIIPFQFYQLMQNLIGNALKFSRPEVSPEIDISSEMIDGSKLPFPEAYADRKYYHLRISDNGIGFDPQYKNRIFEVFQRLHGRDEYKGTGIGLAIVKKIVENHNGFIVADGELNNGATFNIYFPQT